MGVADRDEFTASLSTLVGRDGMAPVTHAETVEVRGDHLCVTVGTHVRGAGEESEWAAVLRVTSDGRIDRIIVFDPDDVESAIDEMRRLYLLELGTHPEASTAVKVVFGRFTPALESGDRPAAYTCLSPQMRRVDRRTRLSMPPADKAAYVASLEALYAGGDTFSYPGELIATRGDDLLLVDTRIVRSSGSESRILAIVRVDRDELIDLMVAMDPDDLEAAMTELDRRAARRTDEGVPHNLASAAIERLAGFFDQPGASGVEAVLHPDMARDDRRSGFSMGVADRTQYIASLPLLAGPEGGSAHIDVDVVEVRGDHLAVISGPITRSTGEVSEFIAVIRAVPDGRIDRIIVFDPDDVESALDEMRRLYLEEVAQVEPSNRAAELFRRFSEEVGPDNLSLIEEMFSDDYLRVDHRIGMPFPPADRAGQVEAVAALYEVGMEPIPIRILEVRGETHVLMESGFVHPDGQASPTLMLVAIDDEERFDRCAFFDSDQLAEATAELDRMYAESLEPAPLGNGATRVFAELADRMRPGRVAEVMRELVSPDYVRVDRREGLSAPTADWEAQVEAMEAVYDVGMDVDAFAVLAVRGDRLALVKFSFVSEDEREVPFLSVLRNNAAGLADRYTYYGVDQLAEAAQELDRQFLEGEGAGCASVLAPMLGFGAAVNRDDRTTLHDFFLGSDVVLIDHTPGSFGLQTPEEACDRLDSMLDLVPGLRRLEAEFHRVNDQGAVSTSDHYRLDDELGSPSWRYHVVALIDDGRAAAVEIFPEDQLEQALARFDELTVEHDNEDGGG